jgi:hypothetical protein
MSEHGIRQICTRDRIFVNSRLLVSPTSGSSLGCVPKDPQVARQASLLHRLKFLGKIRFVLANHYRWTVRGSWLANFPPFSARAQKT